MTGEFPAQRIGNAEIFSIWWRHHDWVFLLKLMIYFTHMQETKQQIVGKQWMRHIYIYAVDMNPVINLAYGVYKQ